MSKLIMGAERKGKQGYLSLYSGIGFRTREKNSHGFPKSKWSSQSGRVAGQCPSVPASTGRENT